MRVRNHRFTMEQRRAEQEILKRLSRLPQEKQRQAVQNLRACLEKGVETDGKTKSKAGGRSH